MANSKAGKLLFGKKPEKTQTSAWEKILNVAIVVAIIAVIAATFNLVRELSEKPYSYELTEKRLRRGLEEDNYGEIAYECHDSNAYFSKSVKCPEFIAAARYIEAAFFKGGALAVGDTEAAEKYEAVQAEAKEGMGDYADEAEDIDAAAEAAREK